MERSRRRPFSLPVPQVLSIGAGVMHPSTASAEGAVEHWRGEIDAVVKMSLASAMRAAYARTMQAFLVFCREHSFSVDWPALVDSILAY